MSFTHLQVRSSYSLLDSTITIEKLVKKAIELEYDALALTDYQVLYGAIDFYRQCKAYGIKPIIGMIITVRGEKNNDKEQVTLLAKNNHGYQNLAKLSTHIQKNGEGGITINELSPYVADCVGILSINHSSIAKILSSNLYEDIHTLLSGFMNLFKQGDFYLGIEASRTEIDTVLIQKGMEFKDQYSIPVVALNDVRYLEEKEAIAFDCLQAMKMNEKWNGKQISTHLQHHHLRSKVEMDHIFISWPEVLTETENIKAKCDVNFQFNQRHLPSFPLPNGNEDAHEFLEKLCWKAVNSKYTLLTDELRSRLTYELRVIESMQFSDYFLIVADFIRFAKQNNIFVGPGRGSAAGSLVAYILGITEIDPIEYDLLFERFLNPERMTMPDIDIDFSDTRRDEVLMYIREKYGHDHVAQIITFGTYAARSLLRELIKTMDINQQDASFILRHIPVQSKKSIVHIVNESKELKEYVKGSEQLKVLFTVATTLEGIPRHISTHAAGIVITQDPLVEYIPLATSGSDIWLTQFPMNDLEDIGLLKIDLLGLRNLTLMERVNRTINYSKNKTIHLNEIPADDQETFALLKEGKTNGVFQLESQGMKQVLRELQPSTFEDIVAVNALYRPGPMEYIPTYIKRKHQQEAIVYPHPDLASILVKTYGVLVYQEQIMQIASKIAGFSLGEADILRRAVSKKQEAVMEEQKGKFIDGCIGNGYDLSVAEELFAWIVKFSNYGFNRSHAVAYSKITYQLAYLKTHFPAAFFAELLSSSVNQHDKLQTYVREMKELQLTLLPPSINKSYGRYSVEGDCIRIGLLQIKGIGKQVVHEIVQARKERPFKNLFDFCLRISLKTVNRQTIELLVMSGAMDEFHGNRASLMATIDQAIEQGELFKEFQGQPRLFDDQIELEGEYVLIEDFTQIKKLADEKELLGIYVSDHPLTSYRKQLQRSGYIRLAHARKLIGKRNVKSAAVIQQIKTIRTKRGDPMAFLTLGDETGEMEAVVFPDLYRQINRWLKEELLVIMEGKIESRNQRIQWLLSSVELLSEEVLYKLTTGRLFIKISGNSSESELKKIKQIANHNPGNTPIIIFQEDTRRTYQLSEEYFIHPNRESIKNLETYFGKESVVFDSDKQ